MFQNDRFYPPLGEAITDCHQAFEMRSEAAQHFHLYPVSTLPLTPPGSHHRRRLTLPLTPPPSPSDAASASHHENPKHRAIEPNTITS
ncbi:hypothetical protein RchiOBHm_Chr2g0143481 [Rosa chinensis]|uniref:Uncharacterized protein n=1 Tax=Rosa chinensis TaxID=74649 RepID=A0A2P6RY50_ROSCH|nr:hypothetical protein RchiOBHm_Chr2g0143481 [Rosa chinensis]